jgi:hypothetical protein
MAQALHAVVDGEQPTDDEDADGRQQRPVVAGLPVAQGVAVVGGAQAVAHADVQQHLVAGVGDRMGGLRQQRRRAGQHRGDTLGHGNQEIRGDRHDHGTDARVLAVAHRTSRHPAVARRPGWYLTSPSKQARQITWFHDVATARTRPR